MSFLVCVLILAVDSKLISELNEIDAIHSANVVTSSNNVTQTIIHLKDWHYISKANYIIDKKTNGADGLPTTYAKFVESVRKVQAEQEAVLRMLIAKHGLTTVHKEGWIVGEKLLPDDAQIVTSMSKVLWSPRALTKPELESQRLNIGPAGKLLAEKKLKSLKSCEDFTLFEACNPFGEDGRPRDVPEKTLEVRETFIVNHIVKKPREAVRPSFLAVHTICRTTCRRVCGWSK